MEVVPLPKFHLHAVGFPVEVLVKVTVNGAAPESVLAVKTDLGAVIAGEVTTSVFVLTLDPPVFVTVRDTVYDPALL